MAKYPGKAKNPRSLRSRSSGRAPMASSVLAETHYNFVTPFPQYLFFESGLRKDLYPVSSWENTVRREKPEKRAFFGE